MFYVFVRITSLSSVSTKAFQTLDCEVWAILKFKLLSTTAFTETADSNEELKEKHNR